MHLLSQLKVWMDVVKGEIISWIYSCIDVTCIMFILHLDTMIPHDSIISYAISTLVRRLANELSSTTMQNIDINQVHICATPTASISNVRPVFDKAGGSIARAFYMCSNYILQYEIRKACKQRYNDEKISVFIVDRWYSSTCAYTIGYKNTNGPPTESIDLLPDSLFKWPRDLSPPDLMIILEVDDDVRIKRVSNRAEEVVILKILAMILHKHQEIIHGMKDFQMIPSLVKG